MDKPKIEIVTPQFNRPKGEPVPTVPTDWDALFAMSAKELRELGLKQWNDPKEPDPDPVDGVFPKGKILMLLPGEWYRFIPNGLEFTTIFGAAEVFQRGITDDDIRFGCLAIGILAEE